MIVAMDIGNTNIKAAVFEGSRLVKRWRCATDPVMTSDQYGIIMADLFRYHNLNMQAVEGIMISSVVPTINYTIEHMCRDYFHLEPRLLVPGMKTGLNIRYENPRELGSDRIANAVAAYEEYGAPTIFIDFGTATTFGVVGEGGVFLGGCICPGVKISMEALTSRTALLPGIQLDRPKRAIGRNSIDCMRSGAIYGNADLLDGMFTRMEKELGEPVTIIATGGLAQYVLPLCTHEIVYDDGLLLKGLKILYDKNTPA